MIIALLALWVVVAVIGFAVKSLLWLAIIGIVLFVRPAFSARFVAAAPSADLLWQPAVRLP